MRLLCLVLYCLLAMSSFANAEFVGMAVRGIADDESYTVLDDILIPLRCVGRSYFSTTVHVFIATKQRVVQVYARQHFWSINRSVADTYKNGDGGAFVTITDNTVVYGKAFFSPDNSEHISSNSIDRHTGILNTYDGQSYDCSPEKVKI